MELILILAIAISIDGFNVGLTYGLRNIKLDIIPLLIISSITVITIYITNHIGAELAGVLNVEFAEKVGSILLILIGSWLSLSSILGSKKDETSKPKEISFSLKIRSLNIFIKILKKPTQADFDKSGSINYIEAVFLGLALALDAMAVGFSTGMMGISSILLIVTIGITNFLFISSGYFIGSKIGKHMPEKYECLPGILIIILGIVKFI